jgi:cell division protein FtsB
VNREVKAANPVVRAARSVYRRRRTAASGFAVLLGLGFGYHAVFGHNGISAYAQKRSEGRALDDQIRRLEEENARLKDHVDHLQTDPGAIEHEARERLHYARPGEVIYAISDPGKPGR